MKYKKYTSSFILIFFLFIFLFNYILLFSEEIEIKEKIEDNTSEIKEDIQKIDDRETIPGLKIENKTQNLNSKEVSDDKKTPVKSITTSRKKDNLIRLNLEKNGQKIEIQLDPLAIDAYIDIRYNNFAGSQEKQNTDEVLQDRFIDNTEKEKKQEEQVMETEKEQDLEKKVKEMISEIEPAKEDKSMTEKVLSHIIKAQELFYENDYEAALEEAKTAVRIEKTAAGYSLLGSIFYMMEDTEGAIAAWEKSLSIDPEQTEVKEVLNELK